MRRGLRRLLIAPDSVPVVWALILGIGLGAGQAVAGVRTPARAYPDHVAALSTVAQTGGYLIAATGPILASILHDATGSWTAPVTAFLVLLAVNAVASMRAGHDPKPGRQAG